MKPLVVLATDSCEPSGVGEHMLTLGKALAGQYEVVIACQDSNGGSALLERAARAQLRVKALDPHQLPALGAWLTTSGAALLHVHAGIGWEGHDLVRAGKAARLPVIRTEHLPYLLSSPVQQAAYTAMLMSVHRVIAVSNAAFESFADRHVHRLSVVANGIQPHEAGVDRMAMRASLGLLAQDQMLLTVARFTPQKGYSTLLAAIPKVLEHQPDAKFFFVGDGPEQAAIADAIHANGLGQAVSLLGRRTDVADLLGAADAFVLPSLFEGLPLAVLEAMAAGLPIVATSIGGTLEALGSDHPFLVQPDDPVSLADAIEQVLSDPVAAQASADAAKARFHTHFQADRMGQQTSAIYATALADPLTNAQVRSA